jgi:hypothetical protein
MILDELTISEPRAAAVLTDPDAGQRPPCPCSGCGRTVRGALPGWHLRTGPAPALHAHLSSSGQDSEVKRWDFLSLGATGDGAQRLVHATAGRIGAVASGTTKAAWLPGWLRLALLDALATFMDGAADTCCHAPVPSSPQPVMAAAWRPGLVVCMTCTHLLPQRRGSAADRTCDGCGRVCAGTPDDPIHPGLLALSILIFEYGVCNDCKPPPPPTVAAPATVAASPRSATTPVTEGVRTTAYPRHRARGRRGTARGRGAHP